MTTWHRGVPPVGRTILAKDYGREFEGRVRHVIPAGSTPDRQSLLRFFSVQEIARDLVHVDVPLRPSKYDRVLVQRRPGRCFVFSVDKYWRWTEVADGRLAPISAALEEVYLEQAAQFVGLREFERKAGIK